MAPVVIRRGHVVCHINDIAALPAVYAALGSEPHQQQQFSDIDGVVGTALSLQKKLSDALNDSGEQRDLYQELRQEGWRAVSMDGGFNSKGPTLVGF